MVYQDELEVVFSLMTDKELMEMKSRVGEMIKGKAYKEEGFPISCAGLVGIQNTIMFLF